ncbi:hypothetical protein PIIN_11306 [Serendipita indica DSM 11827]|uniref:Uncharacterized protein n=1 Tax=Serendipita indica (strain DSM 11827) TaxID=1109443 RepID=G4U186_SERID|nr:hypothetical protein PIIN_11306 [Serendipita indica DSM 11827]
MKPSMVFLVAFISVLSNHNVAGAPLPAPIRGQVILSLRKEIGPQTVSKIGDVAKDQMTGKNDCPATRPQRLTTPRISAYSHTYEILKEEGNKKKMQVAAQRKKIKELTQPIKPLPRLPVAGPANTPVTPPHLPIPKPPVVSKVMARNAGKEAAQKAIHGTGQRQNSIRDLEARLEAQWRQNIGFAS